VTFPAGIGSVIAIIVLVLCIVLAVINRDNLLLLALIGALSVARLT